MVMFGYLVPLLLLHGRNRLCFSVATCANNVAMVHFAFNVWRRLICSSQCGGIYLQHSCKFPCVREICFVMMLYSLFALYVLQFALTSICSM